MHTLDRYWKIVHPIHHRKYYRGWMTYVGMVLPWLLGIAKKLTPMTYVGMFCRGCWELPRS